MAPFVTEHLIFRRADRYAYRWNKYLVANPFLAITASNLRPAKPLLSSFVVLFHAFTTASFRLLFSRWNACSVGSGTPDELLGCFGSVFWVAALWRIGSPDQFRCTSLYIGRQNVSVDYRVHSAAAVMCYIISEDPWARPRSSHASPSQDINSTEFPRQALFGIISRSFLSPHIGLGMALVKLNLCPITTELFPRNFDPSWTLSILANSNLAFL